jgi:hypothetical protein
LPSSHTGTIDSIDIVADLQVRPDAGGRYTRRFNCFYDHQYFVAIILSIIVPNCQLLGSHNPIQRIRSALFLQEKAVENTKKKEEKRKKPQPEEQEGMPQRQHCPHQFFVQSVNERKPGFPRQIICVLKSLQHRQNRLTVTAT